MRAAIVSLLAMLIFNVASAQLTFQKNYGLNNVEEFGNEICRTRDGGFIMAGLTDSLKPNGMPAGIWDILLIKTARTGEVLWSKRIDGNFEKAVDFVSIDTTTDGGFIIATSTKLAGAGNYDCYIIKMDSTGNLVWSKVIGTPQDDFATTIKQALGGGYIVAGNSTSQTNSWDMFIIKLTTNGILSWSKKVGGVLGDGANSIKQTKTGDYIIAGSSNYLSNVSGSYGIGALDVLLTKISAGGNLLWTKHYGGLSYDYGNAVTETADSGYIICGYTQSFGAGQADMYLIKTDVSGNLQWSKTFGGTGLDEALDVIQTHDLGYAVCGRTSSFGGAYFIKTDASGNLLWGNKYGTTIGDQFFSLVELENNQYALLGISGSNPNFYLVMTDSTGRTDCYASAVSTTVNNPNTLSASGGIIYSAGVLNPISPNVYSPSYIDNVLCYNLTCAMAIAITGDTLNCAYDNNGVLDATVQYNTGNVTYNWSNNISGQNIATIINLSPGVYSVTATDDIGCSAVAFGNVDTIRAPHILNFTPIVQTCSNINDGGIITTISSGIDTTYYFWNNGDNTENLDSVMSGVYFLTITDAAGCFDTSSFYLPVGANCCSYLLHVDSTNTTCHLANGSATVSVLNGTGNYSFLWSNGDTTQATLNLVAGIYFVTVTDLSHSCAVSTAVFIETSDSFFITGIAQMDESCRLANDGFGRVEVNTTIVSNYFWYNSAGDTVGSDASVHGLDPGSYMVIVSDSFCADTAIVQINQGPVCCKLEATFSIDSPTCSLDNGRIICTGLIGENISYSVTWSDANSIIGNSLSLLNIDSGIYHFNATDSFGCFIDTTFLIASTTGEGLTLNATKTTMCSGDTSIVCVADNFTNYLWNTGDTSRCINVLLAGNYYLTATDTSGCVVVSPQLMVNVLALPPVSISVNGDTLFAYNAVTYQWYFNDSIISGANNEMIIANSTGYYAVVVTDTNGCYAKSLPVLVTAISKTLLDEISVYPNPQYAGAWNLTVGREWLGSVLRLMDDSGRLIYTCEVTTVNSKIELNLLAGVYFMQVSSAQGIFTRRLLKY